MDEKSLSRPLCTRNLHIFAATTHHSGAVLHILSAGGCDIWIDGGLWFLFSTLDCGGYSIHCADQILGRSIWPAVLDLYIGLFVEGWRGLIDGEGTDIIDLLDSRWLGLTL